MVSKRRSIAVFLTVLLSLALSSSEAYTDDWPELFEKIQSKYAAFEQEITDITMEQETVQASNMGMSSRVKIFKKGNKFRMQMAAKMPGMPTGMGQLVSTIIYNGKETWMIAPFIGKQKLPAKEALKHQFNSNWWELVSSDSRIMGTEVVVERRCYVIEIRGEEASLYDKVWIDAESLDLVQAESSTMAWVNSDFRKIDDRWEMPYKTEVYMGGALTATVQTKSIEINKGVPDDFFNPHIIKAKGPGLDSLMGGMLKGMASGEE